MFAAATKAHPDQQFLEVDSCVKDQPKNLTCVAFKEHEAAYVAGVEAGKTTKSGKIGVVAALDTPFIHRWVEPFFEGAKSVNPGVQGTALYVGGQNPFSDPARAKAQAQTLAGRGVDVVLAAASAGNAGRLPGGRGGRLQGLRRRLQPVPGQQGRRDRQRPEARRRRGDGGDQRRPRRHGRAAFKVYGLKEKGVGVGAVLGGQFLTDCTVASDSAATRPRRRRTTPSSPGRSR